MDSKPSNLAGTWYPRDAGALRAQIDALLEAAAADESAEPAAALIVPHAGYRYSGRAAAAGYTALRGQRVRRVVVLAPSHYAIFRGAAVPDFEAFETPLGLVRVDVEAARALGRRGRIRSDAGPYDEEHAVEIQLPFLQRVCPDAAVVPLLVGELREEDESAVVAATAPLLDDETVLVVSTDFTHYGARFGYEPFPASGAETVAAQLAALDGGAIERVVRGEVAGFKEYVTSTGATICGRLPIAILLRLRAGAGGGRLLAYYTSLDVTGDYRHSVSYAAIAFPRAAVGADAG